ncbi:MAG: hypothetical protein AVDCRST_MAG19-134, partial [uncultured Thermomicrobiales bacterium]
RALGRGGDLRAPPRGRGPRRPARPGRRRRRGARGGIPPRRAEPARRHRRRAAGTSPGGRPRPPWGARRRAGRDAAGDRGGLRRLVPGGGRGERPGRSGLAAGRPAAADPGRGRRVDRRRRLHRPGGGRAGRAVCPGRPDLRSAAEPELRVRRRPDCDERGRDGGAGGSLLGERAAGPQSPLGLSGQHRRLVGQHRRLRRLPRGAGADPERLRLRRRGLLLGRGPGGVAAADRCRQAGHHLARTLGRHRRYPHRPGDLHRRRRRPCRRRLRLRRGRCPRLRPRLRRLRLLPLGRFLRDVERPRRHGPRRLALGDRRPAV